MSIIETIEENLTGEPLVDSILIGIMFIMFWSFYNVIFESIFSIFRKN